jgi:hypothetical protein
MVSFIKELGTIVTVYFLAHAAGMMCVFGFFYVMSLIVS